MNILFVVNNGINESLILPDIIAFLKARRHNVDLLIAAEEKGFLKKLAEFDPGLIVMSVPIYDKKWYFELAKELKKRSWAKILFWGACATFYPEEVLKESSCDFICRGEGEYAIAELAEKMESKHSYHDIKNIGFLENGKPVVNPLRPLIDDLDGLPMPDRSVYYKYHYLKNINMKRFLSSRGCTQLCKHCWNNAISNVYGNPDNFYRRKSPERMIEEICRVKQEYPVSSIHFSDDLFFHPDHRYEFFRLLDLYRDSVNIRFTCNIRPDFITQDLAGALKGANCKAVAMSVESGCPRIRNEVLSKKINDEQIIQAAGILHKNRIKVMTFNIMAFPSEGIEDIYKTIDFNNSFRPQHSRIITLFPICNSDLYKFAVSNDMLKDDPFNKVTDISRELYNAAFYKGNKAEYANIFFLFPIAVKLRLSSGLLKILVRLPFFHIYKLFFVIVSNLNEKQFFGIGLFSGLRYFLHTRGVSRRSENLTSIY